MRWHYLDTMRGMLMLLGVVLHAARPYGSAAWRVNDPRQIPALDLLVEIIHLFRMPAFFVVAGFFAMYLLHRRSTATFLRERMRRVLVPLVVMLISVNTVQVWFLARQAGTTTGDFLGAILMPALLRGELVSHLWFLACLAIYFALAALIAPYLRVLAERGSHASGGRAGDLALGLALAAAVVAPLAVAAVGKLTHPMLNQFVLGLVRISTLLDYLPWFAVGVLLCAYPRMLDRFARIDAWVLGLGLCGGIGLSLGVGREAMGWRVLTIVSGSLLAWMAVRAVFALFRRYADRPSRTFRYLSDASYSVYLFHHIVVIMAATWLLEVAINPWMKFALVLVAASLVSLAIYHFMVRRHAVMRYLFNGAARPPPAPEIAAADRQPQGAANGGVEPAVHVARPHLWRRALSAGGPTAWRKLR